MKNFIFSFLFFSFSTVVFAKGFYCLPSMRQTTIFIEEKNEKIIFSVKNPMGYDYMTQFDGPTSPSSLSMQKFQFDDLKELGNEFQFSWDSKKCTLDEKNFVLDCDGPSEIKMNKTNMSDIKIQSYFLSTTEMTEKTRAQVYNKNKYKINLDKEGSNYFVSLEFFKETCKTY